jgi:hypothetical protein
VTKTHILFTGGGALVGCFARMLRHCRIISEYIDALGGREQRLPIFAPVRLKTFIIWDSDAGRIFKRFGLTTRLIKTASVA